MMDPASAKPTAVDAFPRQTLLSLLEASVGINPGEGVARLFYRERDFTGNLTPSGTLTFPGKIRCPQTLSLMCLILATEKAPGV